MKINCIAVDDEPLALQQLTMMIERTPYFELVGACEDAFQAIKVINEQQVDAIFVDINMPDLNGLEFVRSLTTNPIVVFTTAYREYALEGFEVNAVDYLLKPFGMPEFQKSAAKVKRQFELEQLAKNDNAPAKTENILKDNVLFVKADYRTVRVNLSEIIYIESKSEYLRMHLENGEKLMFLMSIKKMAEMLPDNTFLRIHRSFIINANKVQEYSKLRFKMSNGDILAVGDLYKSNVQDFINLRIINH